MVYREAPRELVILCVGDQLVAIDASDGTIVWQQVAVAPIDWLYRVGGRLFLVCGTIVLSLEHDTGDEVAQLDIGFVPYEGIVHGTDLVLVAASVLLDSTCMVCLRSDGSVRWRAQSKVVKTGLITADTVLSTFAPDGARRSEARLTGYPSGNPGLLLGATTVQPDPTG